ncbi:hypothetical protein CLV59_103257 [Chitinophaga dinghuensis]|uniref:Uncharacterized protein n=2 Tax=Chitinophaga dinghuensis TaxID=1539050 RepID=A0A327W3Q9_9BACT|nr:hypothetical protein CLV59_103257 [Chitinophaga dinghuensis]
MPTTMTKRNSTKGVAGLLLAGVLIVVLLLSGIPGRSVSRNKCANRSAIVETVNEASPGIVVHLRNDPKIYFIAPKNNHGLTVNALRQKLAGKETQLLIAHAWSPLDPFSSLNEIEEIRQEGQLLYSMKQ